MKRPAKIAIIISSVLLLAILVLVANVARSHMRVRGIEVAINYGDSPRLVDQKTVVDTLMRLIPDLMQKQVSQVNSRQVASAALHVPFLSNVTASVSVSGKILVQADQRRPVARLFFGNNERYIDREGRIMPTSDLGDCNVVVATGDFIGRINSDTVKAQISSLWKVACFLDANNHYKCLIDQLHVQRNGEVLMVPKVGDQIIELGDTSDLDEKFADLMAFYRNGMPRAGWHTYSLISLKFKDQVVCTKKNQ